MKFTGFPNLLDAPAQIAGDVASSMFGTPYGQYIRGVLGSNNREYGTEIFKENEVDLLKDLAVEQIKNGSFQIDYKNLDADITKKLSYKMELPENMSAQDALATTLGTSSLRRSGDRLVNVDEYDFQEPSYDPKDVSLYGVAHQIGEVLRPPGHGPSIRADLGTWEELGLTKEQFNKVPSLESYEKNIPEDKPDAWEGVAKWLSSSIDEIL